MFFSWAGFGCAATFEDINNENIDDVEKFVRTKLNRLLEKNAERHGKSLDDKIKKSHFGSYSENTHNFRYSDEERALILKCGQFAAYSTCVKDIQNDFINLVLNENDIDITEKEKITNSDDICDANRSTTHFFLNLLLTAANKNIKRKKEGFRFNGTIKKLASYYRMIAGTFAYESLQQPLKLSLPSISSTNRYIRKLNTNIVEGALRTNELLKYLEDRGLPLIIALSEDATRLTGTVQYDVRTNQIMGFSLPIDPVSGMPIPYTFQARNSDEIIGHFGGENMVGNFVNVVMAQPLADVPPFCLLLYSTNSKYSSLDVSNRWKYIEKELLTVNIEILVYSTDSDPKYNSAMRRLSLLGKDSPIFADKAWFSCGTGILRKPFFVQDTVHVGGKMRNQMLKTRANPRKLAFGKKYFIRIDHLDFLVKNFTKDQHLLTPSVLNPIDRMNFPSVLRMCDEKVLNLLKEHVKDSVGTVTYLKMLRDIIDSYRDKTLKPLERIRKIWYSVFICRLWREYITKRPYLTLENNFLTQNCYSCIELNAHSLVMIMLYLKERDLPKLFRPEFFESQPCEQMFRQIRSFTSAP